MKGKGCCGSAVVGHILLIAGLYVLTWGFIGSYAWNEFLRSPIFWDYL